ncbi:hypothetical protein QQF64_028345 [Cirrhinus molitorella]|uniref:Uncharacterized protein n=1 Tax=Cirrhinus molitorella TaxID=172907 RepID=A0ABR3N6P7_9TELE
MKRVYRVPFERNSDRVKNQRVEYVQRMFEIEGQPVPHEIIFVDEAEKQSALNVIEATDFVDALEREPPYRRGTKRAGASESASGWD